VLAPCRLVGNSNVSEKHTVSIFRAEDHHRRENLKLHRVDFYGEETLHTVRLLESLHTSNPKMETVSFSETLASTDESTRRQNPDHHHRHRRNNMEFNKAVHLYPTG
jgi:hypothetical protein